MIGLKLALAAGSAFCSLLFEFLLLQVMSHLTGEVLVWQSLTLGVYLAALGGGVMTRTYRAAPYGWQQLLGLELRLTLSGALMVPCLLLLHMGYRIYWREDGLQTYVHWWHDPLHGFALLCQFFTCALGFLAGQEMAVLLGVLRQERLLVSCDLKKDAKFSLARFQACYYVGALVATGVFSCLLLPKLSIAGILTVAAIFNALLAFAIASYCGAEARRRNFASAVGVLILALIACYGTATIEVRQRQNIFYNNLQAGVEGGAFSWREPLGLRQWFAFARALPQIKVTHTPYQKIEEVPLLHYPQGADVPVRDKDHFSLYLNGHYQFDTRHEADYHEHMAHIPPMIFRSIPARILVLGGGDGLLLRELLKYGSQISSLTLVELDAAVIELARRSPLKEVNGDSLRHAKVKVITEDAFLWLRNQQGVYDGIYIDLPFPFNFDSGRLYSSEFFTMLARRLSNQGYLVIDFPLTLKGASGHSSGDLIAATLHASGFLQVLGFTSRFDSFVAARKSSLPLTFSFKADGIPLTALDASWFARPNNWYVWPPDKGRLRAHTLLWPQVLSYRDHAF